MEGNKTFNLLVGFLMVPYLQVLSPHWGSELLSPLIHQSALWDLVPSSMCSARTEVQQHSHPSLLHIPYWLPLLYPFNCSLRYLPSASLPYLECSPFFLSISAISTLSLPIKSQHPHWLSHLCWWSSQLPYCPTLINARSSCSPSQPPQPSIL